MISALPPVGSRIALGRQQASALVFPNYDVQLLNSGTAALALAMSLAARRSADVDKPEVIIPAYACPDLVSAAVYAGLTAIVVDIDVDYHGYSLPHLAEAITENTVAIVAINFLGIAERLTDIKAQIEKWPKVLLIEDNAQWYPESGSLAPLVGDFVCLSFGRGKPVSLLGGGALLVAEQYKELLVEHEIAISQKQNKIIFLAKLFAYNVLLAPAPYGVLSKMPMLNLGVTRYKALATISVMDEMRQSLLTTNIERYRVVERTTQDMLREISENASSYNLIDLAKNTPAGSTGKLLRYPVLCDSRESRNELYNYCQQLGLGASLMYKQALVEIEGVAELVVDTTNTTNAVDFSQRLMTLPVHPGVKQKHLDRIQALLD